MRRLTFLIGIAIGYVLGAKAGHDRYQQIVTLYNRIADRPGVRMGAGVAAAKVSGLLGRGNRAA